MKLSLSRLALMSMLRSWPFFILYSERSPPSHSHFSYMPYSHLSYILFYILTPFSLADLAFSSSWFSGVRHFWISLVAHSFFSLLETVFHQKLRSLYELANSSFFTSFRKAFLKVLLNCALTTHVFRCFSHQLCWISTNLISFASDAFRGDGGLPFLKWVVDPINVPLFFIL